MQQIWLNCTTSDELPFPGDVILNRFNEAPLIRTRHCTFTNQSAQSIPHTYIQEKQLSETVKDHETLCDDINRPHSDIGNLKYGSTLERSIPLS